MCSEIVEELNLSKFIINYFLYNGIFWCCVWCFLVFGVFVFLVLLFLIFFVFIRDIIEDIFCSVFVIFVIVFIVVVFILVCCYYCKNVLKVSYFLNCVVLFLYNGKMIFFN